MLRHPLKKKEKVFSLSITLLTSNDIESNFNVIVLSYRGVKIKDNRNSVLILTRIRDLEWQQLSSKLNQQASSENGINNNLVFVS